MKWLNKCLGSLNGKKNWAKKRCEKPMFLTIGWWITDGWFDDPIGLSARTYMLVPQNVLGKFLLVQRYLIPWSSFSPIPKLTHHHPIGHYSAWPSHTLTPHSSTPMSLCSTLMHHLLIGCYQHGPSIILVLFLLWMNDSLTNLWSLCDIYRLFVIWAYTLMVWSLSPFFLWSNVSSGLLVSLHSY